MRVARAAKTVTRLASATLGGAAAALLLGASVDAADPVTMAVGPPTPLFSPSSPTPSPQPKPQPAHSAAVASPGRHPAVPVQRIPLDAKPLIPPAASPAKLGPPPEPQPALSLETDLEPLAPTATAPSQPGATPPAPIPKPPSS